MDLQERFLHYIQENNLCDPQRDRILLAVSGGRDSVLLMHLFVRAGFEVGIAHCNFALRGTESDADEALVREYAQELGVPFFVKRFETEHYASSNGISIQMAARDLRYTWFESIRRQAGYEYIAVAHHARDNVETLLINLLRGTGLRGLRGMFPERDRIIRPLLFLKYEELEAAVDRFGLRFRDDASNFSTDYLRNKLRLEVIPRLTEINPDLEDTFAKNMENFREVSAFVDGEIAERRAALLKPAEAFQGFLVDVDTLRRMRPLRFVLYELLRPFEFTAAVCADLADVLQRDPPVAGRQFSSATHVLLLDRGEALIRPLSWQEPSQEPISLSRERPAGVWKGRQFEIALHSRGQSPSKPEPEVASAHSSVEKAIETASFDADLVTLPLRVRTWERGDSFRPLGMKGRRRKLSDFFVSQKIPVWEKSRIPLVVDATGVIIWVAPLRMSNDFNISDETQNVMTISYFCEDGSR